MSETMKAALDAALRFHSKMMAPGFTVDNVVDTAKRFHQELVNAAPGAAEDWDESWYSRVFTWMRALSGDQLGSVESAVRTVSAERRPPAPAQYMPVPPVHQEAWALLDKLNGPQPYPGTPAPIGPLVTRDELEQRLAELGGDRNNAGDVATAAGSWRDRTLAPEPAAISEALGRQDGETLLATAERVMSELAGWKTRAEHAEARVAEARPIAPPLAEAGTQIRIRTRGADVYTSTTVATELEYSPTEGFFALVPPGAFAEGRRDEIATESIDALLKALAPAKLSGAILQQVKQLVGTAENRLRRIRDLEESREAFEGSIRILLQAQNESESDDHYCPEQPTLDALVRVLQRLMADESRIDGSMTRDQVLDEIQQGWHDDGHKELKA